LIRRVRDTPNWPRDVYSAIRRLADGDTIIVPHEQAARLARRLAEQHGRADTLWFCEVRRAPVPERGGGG
jgi:hypothetical protein